MPGTIYTRTGPEGDPIGRLADFARFAVAELEAINVTADRGYPDSIGDPALRMRVAAREIAERLDGFTTADDA